MRKRTIPIVTVLALATLILAACTGVLPTHVATLTPPVGVASNAQGAATARKVGASLTVEGDYQDLDAPVTSVRVENTNTSTTLFSLSSTGGTRGTFRGTQDLSADEVTALNSGDLVIILYTDTFPIGGTGELRGSMVPR